MVSPKKLLTAHIRSRLRCPQSQTVRNGFAWLISSWNTSLVAQSARTPKQTAAGGDRYSCWRQLPNRAPQLPWRIFSFRFFAVVLDFVAPIGVVVIIDLIEMQLIGAVSASICEMYYCLAAVDLTDLPCPFFVIYTHLTTKSVLVMSVFCRESILNPCRSRV
jgi:hypothetical protein